MVLVQRLPLVVSGIDEHPIRVHITGFTARLGQDVLGGKVVQGGVCVTRATSVPLTELKRHLRESEN